MKLYEIPAALRTLEDRIEENDGVLTPEMEAELDGLVEAFDSKVEYIAMLVREAQLEATKWKAEEDRVSARRRSLERRAEGLRRYIHTALESSGRAKVQGDKLTVAVQKNGVPSVMIDGSPEHLPEEFRRVKIEPDTTAIRDAWKAGRVMPEGVEVYVGTHVRIR